MRHRNDFFWTDMKRMGTGLGRITSVRRMVSIPSLAAGG